MKKEIKFYVIGGQYVYDCYGGAPTLIGAKRMATKHMEYWDNRQGWHKPSIYKAEDTEVIVSRENTIGIPAGRSFRVPKAGAEASHNKESDADGIPGIAGGVMQPPKGAGPKPGERKDNVRITKRKNRDPSDPVQELLGN